MAAARHSGRRGSGPGAGALAPAGDEGRAVTARTARRGRYALVATAAIAAIAVVVTVVAFARPGSSPGPAFPPLHPAAAPAGWPHAALPNRTAVLSYPPSLRLLAGDTDAVSAARLGPGGAFRLGLLRSDDAASARQDAAAEGVKFRGGTGSCLIDDYVTRIGGHHYQEVACLVQGRTSASVIIAAAPAARWAQVRPLLLRAVAAYRVQ